MAEQLLHLVFGGELKSPAGSEFVDLDNLDLVGIYPDYQTAFDAWRGAASTSVDDAYTRYFIVHVHRLMDPKEEQTAG